MKLPFRTLFRSVLAKPALAVAAVSATLALTTSCLQRPVGTDQPKTTNVIVDNLTQSSVDKIDLLFMIDNSLSMGDKQELLALALPDLVRRLVDPVCIAESGETEQAMGGDCRQGFAREFQPINNIHIGVITSSLGGFGSELDCTIREEGEKDNSHLLGSLDRVRATLTTTPEFLTWCRPDSDAARNQECTPSAETSNGDADAFSNVFADQVRAAGEDGCGWEASLEAWYRFLIDPYPWTDVVRQNCPFGGDTSKLCIGPEADPATGLPYKDDKLLAQRKRFLRPDSLLAIVMLTDENDCSFKASGQSWRLSQTFRRDASGNQAPSRAYKGSAACAADPNDPCCVSCGTAPAGSCATVVDADGDTVPAGCEEPLYKSADDLAQEGSNEPTDDSVNLRCFDHKRRFGVDYLYPVARYSKALSETNICPFADDLDPLAMDSRGELICGAGQEFVVENPLYIDLSYEERRAADPQATPIVARTQDLVFLAGIVGVPWQDLAVDPSASELVYKTNNPDKLPNVDWAELLGSADKGAPYNLRATPPTDPLMHEQIEKRTGTDTSINGGEWSINDRDDLQYACIFPLDEPVPCPALEDLEAGETVACDCTYYGEDEYENPLCNGNTQTHAKAYPSIRPLQVLRDYGKNSIVASICPKNTTNPGADDFGYRPAVAAIIERLKEQLSDKCLSRKLEVKEVEGGRQASCLIVEADLGGAGCDEGRARTPVEDNVAQKVYERLERTRVCEDANGDCRQWTLCGIPPIAPGTSEYDSCLTSETPQGHGWCYIDPDQGLGDDAQVEKCPDTEKRKIRFAGYGQPGKGTTTFFACAGAPQGGTSVEETDAPADTPAEGEGM